MLIVDILITFTALQQNMFFFLVETRNLRSGDNSWPFLTIRFVKIDWSTFFSLSAKL